MGGQLRLEPLGERHLDGIAALVADPEVAALHARPRAAAAGLRARLARPVRAGSARRQPRGFAAVDGGGAFLGLALAPEIDAEAREVELGYIVAPAARGRGVATAMLRELTRWAFAQAGALRAYLLIDTANVASQRVAERCGYVLEGVLRSVYLKQGRRSDQMIWSRLPSDPGPR